MADAKRQLALSKLMALLMSEKSLVNIKNKEELFKSLQKLTKRRSTL